MMMFLKQKKKLFKLSLATLFDCNSFDPFTCFMNFHLYYTTDPNYAGKFPLVLECLPATCMFTPHRPRGVSTIYDYNYCRWWPTASSGEPQSTTNPPALRRGPRARGSKREVLMRYKSPLPYSTEQQESDLHVYRSISDVDVFFFCVASKTLPDFSNAIPIREKNLALGEREEKKKVRQQRKKTKFTIWCCTAPTATPPPHAFTKPTREPRRAT